MSEEHGETSLERRGLGVKLYYRFVFLKQRMSCLTILMQIINCLSFSILESMLVSEESRLKQSNFTTLLNNDSYHKALLTCCLEIVFYAYKMAAFTFPHVLNSFQLKPFELFKVIESVLRHFPVAVSITSLSSKGSSFLMIIFCSASQVTRQAHEQNRRKDIGVISLGRP